MAAPTADIVAEALRPLLEDPRRTAVLCDVDGTIAPIVERAEEARVPPEATRALAALAGRYAVVACVSGRSATDARRLVGVGGIAYAGAHGAELLMPGDRSPTILPEFAKHAERVHGFVSALDDDELRGLGVRVEDKGPIVALHWRGADDEEAARRFLEGIGRRIDGDGLATHWGRKVLEVRPPVPISKARAVQELVGGDVRGALYGGDDTTDLDAFDALDSLVAGGVLDQAVRVGVASEEGPDAIVERADLVVEGPGGFQAVLAALAEE